MNTLTKDTTKACEPQLSGIRHMLVPAGDMKIGVIALDRPQALNAFNGTMAGALLSCLKAWEDREDLALVVLYGEGARGFCAGGDVKDVVSLRQRSGSSQAFLDAANQYFQLEYRTDYAIHTFPKPVVVWGHGWVLGGGWGLFAGGSHRIVTPSTQLSMPELLIGLFPDVAASWFLNRLPPGMGLFLGMTGARVAAADALALGLAEYLLPEDGLPELLAQLQSVSWSVDSDENRFQLHQRLTGMALPTETLPSPLFDHAKDMAQLAKQADVESYAHALKSLPSDDPWFRHAQDQFLKGSPSSLAFIFEFIPFARHLSLKQSFMLDWQLAMHFSEHQEFHEGVRAMLIDKDRSPQWKPANLADVEKGWIRTFLTTPHPSQANPLADLPDHGPKAR